MKWICLLAVVMTAPLCLTGCEYAAAQESAKAVKPTTLWSATEAEEALTILREVRQNTKTLQQIDRGIQDVRGAVDLLAVSAGDTLAAVEGIEQRLDHPTLPPVIRPVLEPVGQAVGNPLCVNIDGIDTDLAEFIAENYDGPWSEDPPLTTDGLRSHLADLGVTGTENIDPDTLEKLHGAVHEVKDPDGLSEIPVSTAAVGDTIQLFGDTPPDTTPAPSPPPNQVTPAPQPQYECINGQCRLKTRTNTTFTTSTPPARSPQVSSSVTPSRWFSVSSGRQRVRRARCR